MPAKDNYRTEYDGILQRLEPVYRDPATAHTGPYFATSVLSYEGLGAIKAMWRDYPAALSWFRLAAAARFADFEKARERSRTWAAVEYDKRYRMEQDMDYKLASLAETLVRAWPEPAESPAAKEIDAWLPWHLDRVRRRAEKVFPPEAKRPESWAVSELSRAIVEGMWLPALAVGSASLESEAREWTSKAVAWFHAGATEERLLGKSTVAGYTEMRAFQAAVEGDQATAADYFARRCARWIDFGNYYEKGCHPTMLAHYIALSRIIGRSLPYAGEKIPEAFSLDEFWGRVPTTPAPERPRKVRPPTHSAPHAGEMGGATKEGATKAEAKVDALLVACGSPDQKERLGALSQLFRAPKGVPATRRVQVIGLALEAAASATADIRPAAARALGSFDPGAPPDIRGEMRAARTRLLSDADPAVVAAAIGGIGEQGKRADPSEVDAAVDALRRLLEDAKVPAVTIRWGAQDLLPIVPAARRGELVAGFVGRLPDRTHYATAHMRSGLDALVKGAPPEVIGQAKEKLLAMAKGSDDHARTVASNILAAAPFAGAPEPVDDWAEHMARAWSGDAAQRLDALVVLAVRAPRAALERRSQLADAIIANGPFISWHVKADLRFVHLLAEVQQWIPDQHRAPMVRMVLSIAADPTPGPGRVAMGFVRTFAGHLPAETMREVVDALLWMAGRPEYSAEALGELAALRSRMDPFDVARVDARLAPR